MKITNAMLPVANLEDRIQFGHHNYNVVLSLQSISERELYIGPIQNFWLSENSRHFNWYNWTGPNFGPMQRTFPNLSNKKRQKELWGYNVDKYSWPRGLGRESALNGGKLHKLLVCKFANNKGNCISDILSYRPFVHGIINCFHA